MSNLSLNHKGGIVILYQKGSHMCCKSELSHYLRCLKKGKRPPVELPYIYKESKINSFREA
jgi:hypothetical protein